MIILQGGFSLMVKRWSPKPLMGVRFSQSPQNYAEQI